MVTNREILDLLKAAADEIAALSHPENDVCRRLRELQRDLAPRSVTIGELAKRIDIAPHDVLDAAIDAGVTPFWHEGQQFREPSYLRTYLRLEYPFDPVRELKIELTPEMASRLAEKLFVTPEELLTDSVDALEVVPPPRKFVASEITLPEQAGNRKRREQMG